MRARGALIAERGSAGGERSDPAALPRVAPFPFARRREGAPAAPAVKGQMQPLPAGFRPSDSHMELTRGFCALRLT